MGQKKDQEKADQELAARVAALGDVLGHENADAVVEYVEYRLSARLGVLRSELVELAAQQRENIADAKADGSPEAAQAANKGSEAVNEAKAAVKEAEADPTPAKVEVAEDKGKKAKVAVAESTVELAAQVAKHDNEIYHPEEGILARVDKLETRQGRQGASLDGVWAVARANAKAIAYGTTAGLGRIARLSIVVFSVCILLWLAIVLVLGGVTFDNSWTIGLGLSAIVAGLVYLIGAATLDGFGRRAPASAEAQADAGVDIVGSGQPPQMGSADAKASVETAARR